MLSLSLRIKIWYFQILILNIGLAAAPVFMQHGLHFNNQHGKITFVNPVKGGEGKWQI
jgi:hypothetical protein